MLTSNWIANLLVGAVQCFAEYETTSHSAWSKRLLLIPLDAAAGKAPSNAGCCNWKNKMDSNGGSRDEARNGKRLKGWGQA